MAPLKAIAVYGRMIKFSHSVFALPFAFSGALLAATYTGITPAQIGWIALAMVGARSAAMGFNRLIDRHLDAANPRTQNRELPRGVVSPQAVGLFVVLSALALVWAAYQLNPLCYLSVAAGSGRALVLFADQALYLDLSLGSGTEFGRGTAGGLDCGHWRL